MTDPMKALDEIEVALSEAAKWVRGDYASFCRDAMLRTLALLPTLRAALTPPADDEIDAIRARHEDFARVIIWSPRGHAEDAHADRATLLRALDAERARRLADMQAAFDAGFMVSGEGWNGEYPGDAPGTEYYIERRIEAIATITKETP